MIKRTHRFHGYGSLKNVYAKGSSVRGGLIGLKYTARDIDRPYRAAVVVSKKVHKSAVTRNRIRRRIYEAVRTSEITPKPGTDLVLTVFIDQVKDISSEKLKSLIENLINKMHN